MQSLNRFIYFICVLAFLAELLLILQLSTGALVVLVIMHFIFFIVGYYLSRPLNFNQLAEIDAARLKGDPIVREFTIDNLYHLAVVLLMVPSLFSHFLGLLLLFSQIRNFLAEYIIIKMM